MNACKAVNHKGQKCQNLSFDATGFCRYHHSDTSLRPSTGKYFEEEVVKTLRVLGHTVDRNVHINGCQIDIYSEFRTGMIPMKLMVECKDYGDDNTVGSEEVTIFHSKLISARNLGVVDKGLFVTTNGFTAPAKTFARTAGIELVTYSDLSTQLVNFDDYIDQLIENYKQSDVSKYYIDLSGTEVEDYEGNDEAYIHRPIDQYIERCLYDDQRGKLALLGNFGTGKSTFCRKYAYDLAHRYKKDKTARIPIIIGLKDYDSKFLIQDLILNTLQFRYGVDISVPKFQSLQRMGRFIFLFDGFDEMDAKANPDTIRENLRELNKISEIKENKFIVTCRTHFFRSKVHAEVLGDIDILYIPEWGQSELEEYLQKRFGNKWESYIKRICGTHNLPELAETPLFLEMIAETLPSLGDHVKRIELYRVYTDKWIKDQSRRKTAMLTANERKIFVKELAVKLFVENRPCCNYREFTDVVREFLNRVQSEGDRRFEAHDAMHLDYLGSDIQTCTFLIRDKQGNYSFRHTSFMEFFVAQELAEEIKRGSFRYLEGGVLPVEIREFLIEFLSGDDDDDSPGNPSDSPPVNPFIDPLRKGLETAKNNILKDNLLTILSRLNFTIPEAAEKQPLEIEASEIARFVKGDAKAFEEIFKLYYPQLIHYLTRHGVSSVAAEDIATDAFFKIWNNRALIVSIHHFKSYLFTIARNKLVDYFRTTKQTEIAINDYNDRLDFTEINDKPIDISSILVKAIKSLPENERQVVDLYHTHNLTPDKISQLLNLSKNKVNSLRRSAIERLKKYIKEHGIDNESY